MRHQGTIRIETPRLLLRPFVMTDCAAAFANWTNDANVTAFLRWKPHENIAGTQEIIKSWMDGYADKNFYQWAIVLKENGDAPIGTLSVVAQSEELSLVHIGYCIGSQYWHKGITSEAFSAVIPFFFEQVAVNRIESQHDPRNANSGKVMQKCGLTYEGTLRQADSSNKGIVDAAMYSLLAEEYFARA